MLCLAGPVAHQREYGKPNRDQQNPNAPPLKPARIHATTICAHSIVQAFFGAAAK